MCNIRELLLSYLYPKHHECISSEWQTEEKQLLIEPNSVQMIDAHAGKLSDYSYPITKSSTRNNYVANRRMESQSRASILL